MLSHPLFSIVVPSYNQAAFLEECLQSILNQSGIRFEILLLDGGSTDSSLDIIRQYADRFVYWKSGPDLGQADAINQGWKQANGEIIGWLNSDDCYCPDALARVAESYAHNPEAALIYGDVTEIRADGSAAGTKHMGGFSLRSLLLGKNMGQPGVFITRKTYAALGGLDDRFQYALDFEYFLRIWTRFPPSDFIYSPHTLAYSRLWDGTKTSTQAGNFGAEYYQVLNEYFRRPDLPAEIQALHRLAYSRSVFVRQARLSLENGDWRMAIPAVARSIWMERSFLHAARMIRFLFGHLVRPLRKR
jgi:glycosyltransferase involved in cell wall biosynthesis